MLINARFSTMEVKAKLEASIMLYQLKVNEDGLSHSFNEARDSYTTYLILID